MSCTLASPTTSWRDNEHRLTYPSCKTARMSGHIISYQAVYSEGFTYDIDMACRRLMEGYSFAYIH